MATNDCTKVDKRSLVVVGELPADFLRVTPVQNPQTFDPALWFRAGGHLNSVQNSIKLSITICQAQLTKNYGLTRMDPYCRLTVGLTIFETQTAVNGARNPVWNKVIITAVPPEIDHVYLDIFDERSFTIDSRFAWACIKIPDQVFAGEQVNDWFPLTGKQGENKEGTVNLVFTLLSDPMEAVSLRSKRESPGGIVKTTVHTDTDNLIPPELLGDVPPGGDREDGDGMNSDPEEEKQKLSSLKDMFPNIEEVVIVTVLEANRGNVDACINSLLDIEAT